MVHAGLLSSSRRVRCGLIAASGLLAVSGCGRTPLLRVSFLQSTHTVEAYDFIEVTAAVSWPHARNPFTDADLEGWFESADGKKRWLVNGFCDAEDGSAFRIRFTPPVAGGYKFAVTYRQGSANRSFAGNFQAIDTHRRGPVRVDPRYPWHFIWEGTREHYFFNGTTAYWLMGWQDEGIIQSSLERLHRLKLNRIRVTIAGRTNQFYGEPVVAGQAWTPFLTAWPAGKSERAVHLLGRAGQRYGLGLARGLFDSLATFGLAEDIYHPGFDYARFNVAYWQKLDRALRFARERDIVFSLVLDMNDSRVHPAAGSVDEHRFIHYAVARFGAFSNITWDLGDDLDQYRDERWTHKTGTLLKHWDPYQHLATSHPVNNAHQDRLSPWFDFTSFQEWSRKQHAFMLSQRQQQQATGRIIPQTNEEYGYEDHHPLWSEGIDSESSDALRRSAWDIVMAGGYQTTGETARRGTNVWPDTGGGWMNGRGDATMVMFQGYAYILDFFTVFEWWKTDPHDEFVNPGNYCLAKPGELYVVYLPNGGGVTLQLAAGFYRAIRFDPTTGATTVLPPAHGPVWTSNAVPGGHDWALLFQKL